MKIQRLKNKKGGYREKARREKSISKKTKNNIKVNAQKMIERSYTNYR